MNPIEKLRAEAREKRDKAIHKARLEYRLTIRELRTIARRLREPGVGKLRYSAINRNPPDPSKCPFSTLTAIKAAELVLLEGEPLTLAELTVQVQKRGCRKNDDPHAVMHCIRGSFRYHRDKFAKDSQGRWSVLD